MTQKKIHKIRFKNTLYGRQEQLGKLIALYDAMDEGQIGFVLVKGASGVGKTSFVSSFAAKIESSVSYFVGGKLDLNRNNPPYAVILQAIGELIEYWIVDSEPEKEQIISILKKEIGGHDKIILRAFPRLVVLFGQESTVEPASPLAFKDRFNEALLSFINALSKLDQRIVFFLDDLQWADQSTLDFLKLLISEGKSENLFWIGAFRNDEIMQKNWLFDPNENENNEEDWLKSIELTGLSLDVIKVMVSDIIEMKPDRLMEFSELLLQLTGGNPLFIKESFPLLLEDEVLYFDLGFWDYDASQLRDFDKSSRTLEFIIKKTENLAANTKEFLGIGAAIGSTFNVTVISAVTEKSTNDIVEALNPAIERRMIELVSNNHHSYGRLEYRFVHDKMQSAAYSMLSGDKKEWIHFALGKTYSSSLGNAAQERNIYNIVNQFNRSGSYFKTPKEQLDLVKMNLQAGKKAKVSGSFNQALQYFNLVIQAIEAKGQNWANEVVFDVYLESGEAAYLKSDFVSSVMFYESALKYSNTNFQKARVYHNFLVMYNSVSDLDVAWESGLKVLNLLGVNFSERVGKGKVIRQFIKIKWMLRAIKPGSLLDRPNIENEEAEQILLTLMEMIASAWGKKPEVLAFLVLKGFEIVLQYGNTPIGYFAVSGYGAILGMGFGKIEKGWEYVVLGGELTQKYESQVFHGRGLFGVHGTYSYLVEHVEKNIQPLNDAFSLSKGTGDYNIAAYSSIILIENMITAGTVLNDVRTKSTSFFKFLKRTANYDYLSSHKSTLVAIDILKYGYEKNEENLLAIKQRMNRVSFEHIKYSSNLYHLMAAVVLNRTDKMQPILDGIDKEGYNALSSVEILRDIYHSIAKVELAMQSNKQQRMIQTLKVMKKRMLKMANLNPQNYKQILALILGLIAELKANKPEAILNYKSAAQAAEENGYVNNAAVFTERLARMYLQTGEKNKARENLENAQVLYSKWGAIYKSEALIQELEVLH